MKRKIVISLMALTFPVWALPMTLYLFCGAIYDNWNDK
jgi:hypothetical protein